MVRKSAHCAYDVHYHLVVVMKYRKNVLRDEKYISYLCKVFGGVAERFPEIKQVLWGGGLWSDGGFVGTVGETADLEKLKRYIYNQGKKVYDLSQFVN